MNKKGQIYFSIISSVTVTLVIILVGCTMVSLQKKTEGISETEKVKIEAWIERNNLNPYGDQKDTVYMGGTPLFDERTGERTECYEYILRRNPDRPWLKLKR